MPRTIAAPATSEWMLELDPIFSAAFPNGPADEDYWPLVTLFADSMSFRGVSNYLTRWFDKPEHEIYYGVMCVMSGPMCEPSEVERVLQRLNAHGYLQWLKTNEI